MHKGFYVMAILVLGSGAFGSFILATEPSMVFGFDIDPEFDEGIERVYGSGHYWEGDPVTLSAEMKNGYLFDGWYDTDGRLLSGQEDYFFYAYETELFARSIRGAYIHIDSMEGILATESDTYHLGEQISVYAVDAGKGSPAFSGWYSADGKLLSRNYEYKFKASSDMHLVERSGSSFYDGDNLLEWKFDKTPGYQDISVTIYDDYSGDYISSSSSYSGTMKLIPGKYRAEAEEISPDGTVKTSSETYEIKGDIKRTYYWIYNHKVYSLSWTAGYGEYTSFLNSGVDRWPYSDDERIAFAEHSSSGIRSLASALGTVTYGMTDNERADCVLKFVQRCTEYEYDDDYAGEEEYWKFPMETIIQRSGDCEDTSLLYCALMRELGYATVLLIYDDYDEGHAASGVALDYVKDGVYYTKAGKKFYYCETTSDSMMVGDCPDEYDSATVLLIP